MLSDKLKEGYSRIISVPLSLFEALLLYAVPEAFGFTPLCYRAHASSTMGASFPHSTHCLALKPHADACTYIHTTLSKCHQKELMPCNIQAKHWNGLFREVPECLALQVLKTHVDVALAVMV